MLSHLVEINLKIYLEQQLNHLKNLDILKINFLKYLFNFYNNFYNKH